MAEVNAIKVVARQLQSKTLPEGLQHLGAVCLVSDFVQRWEGPFPPGLKRVGSYTIHAPTLSSHAGYSFWFFLPEESMVMVPLAAIQSAVHHMLPCLHQIEHAPERLHIILVRPAWLLRANQDQGANDRLVSRLLRAEAQRLRQSSQKVIQDFRRIGRKIQADNSGSE